MTPEQLTYIRDWARNGNEPRAFSSTKLNLDTVSPSNRGPQFMSARTEVTLNANGLLIAKLADALEQANETAEEMRDRLGPHYPLPVENSLETMRANRLELLGR